MARLVLDNASLTFRLQVARRISLKEHLLNVVRAKRSPLREVRALRDVSLNLRDGCRLGVVGHNGAGKSSLLRLLAGIYAPSSGRRMVEGRISSMLDIGVGIEPDASGWDNIRFRGYLQRQTPAELKVKAPEIAAFSELGEFLDAPVRCYSSGMYVRLAFSIATAIEPEILLVDEVFSAGDASFQKKASDRMMSLMEKARILVMAAHDLTTLNNLCESGIWLDHGQVRMEGPIRKVTAAYDEHMRGAVVPSAAA